jgi:HAD superfamily phosphoserine phosphatase-like hydrolase
MRIYNVYDFDGTIYDGDSTSDFFLYCLRIYPICVCRVPRILWEFIKYKLRFIDKKKLKESFFSFLNLVPDIDNAVLNFWKKNNKKIKDFYWNGIHEKDVIISASPEFLLYPICRNLGVGHLIASQVNKETGSFEGENCYGEEKVKRLRNELGECIIETFYTDSKSDFPLASTARKAYLVNKNKIQEWDVRSIPKC